MSTDVCQNQTVFNSAVKDALKKIEDDQCNTNECKTSVVIMYIIILILYIYAIILAMQADKEHRIIHLSMALLLGPLYVLAYYLNTFSN